MGGPRGFQFQVIAGAPALRLWMLNNSENEMLQVQNDRLFLNWRRAPGDTQTYPRYDYLREAYEHIIEAFRNRVKELHAGTFQPHTAVVTYANRFELKPGEALKDAIAPLDETWNLLGDATPEISVTVPVTSGVGSSAVIGQLVAKASTDPSDRAHGYLEVVTRVPLGDPSGDVFDCLDLAHQSCVNGFERLTTMKMHERWGKI
jgi:uncharacterized protein (TIGR04255 family)